MTFFLAILVWLIMGGLLVLGVALAAKGTFWLMIFGLLAFCLAIAKVCWISH